MQIQIEYLRVQIEFRGLGEIRQVTIRLERRPKISQQRLAVLPNTFLFTGSWIPEGDRIVQQIFENTDHLSDRPRSMVEGLGIARDPLPIVGFLYRSPERLLALAEGIVRNIGEEGVTEGQDPVNLFGSWVQVENSI